jgi:hypothetical protein
MQSILAEGGGCCCGQSDGTVPSAWSSLQFVKLCRWPSRVMAITTNTTTSTAAPSIVRFSDFTSFTLPASPA